MPPSSLPSFRDTEEGEDWACKAGGRNDDEDEDKAKVDNHHVEHLHSKEADNPVPGVAYSSNSHLLKIWKIAIWLAV